MASIIGLDFLEQPVAIHFPSSKFKEQDLLVIYTTTGMVGNHSDLDVSGTLPAFTMAGATFTIPGVGVIAPSCPFSFLGNPDGSGSLSFTPGPFTRFGIPNTAAPASDAISEDMLNKLVAWQGQYVTSSQASQGMTGDVCFVNVDGYLVVNLSKLKKNFSCQVHIVTQPHDATVAVASFRGSKAVPALSHTVLLSASDNIETTAPGGVDQWPFNPNPAVPPSQAIGYGFKGLSGTINTATITCNLASLAVTVI